MTSTLQGIESIRYEFEALGRITYFDVAARAPMSNRVADELRQYIGVSQAYGAHKQAWSRRVESVRERVGDFIGASSTEIAFMKNTSDGLNALAHGLRPSVDDNVVVCPAIEHPNNVYMWLSMRQRGVEIRLVHGSNGEFPIDEIESEIDDRTKIVVVSSVSFYSGARAPLKRLSEICRRHGSFLMVDAVQELGVMNFNVKSLGVDGLAAATQKGLLSLYGLGILYCSSEWLPKMDAPYLSRTAIDLGDAHESVTGDLDEYRVKESAGKFEVGNPNYIGTFALDASLLLLADVGINAVESHVLSITRMLIRELESRGYDVITPRQDLRHAGIVSFQHPQSTDLLDHLEKDNIKVALRLGSIRVSSHIYNTVDDVERLLHSLDRFESRHIR